ncbi:MAG: DUF6702 family protein [Saprospiraceae bacterium]|nr:DUF6702 family protein [Saprospiraceae bacterium]
MGRTSRITIGIDGVRLIILSAMLVLTGTDLRAAIWHAPVHDFHVSRCEIYYRPSSQALEIAQQIFLDDFEAALTAVAPDTALHLGTPREHAQADVFITAYLNEKFSVQIGDQFYPFNFVGKELSEDLTAIWLYLEVPGVQHLSIMTVEFGVLFELFADQKNILSFQVDTGRAQLFLLDPSKPRIEIQIP